MDKLEMHSLDLVEENKKLIGKLFPNAVTEVIRDGEVKHAIDFDVLRQELSDCIVEGREERYQFTWPDKKKSMLDANAPITATLRPIHEDSVGKDGTPGGFDSENLYIEGDNLEVLKLLQETYLGAVKMIYIDPPYNTGSDFIYKDNFAEDAAYYRDNSGQFDEEGDRMVTNFDTNGRYHTDWLNMIYPRLKLAKNLLRDDGVIFISIDDHEVENLKKICDEIFGASNFIGTLVLKTATDNNPSQINTEHEYMICFAKNKQLQANWLRSSKPAKKIIEKYKELKNQDLSIDAIQIELRKWINANKDSLPQVAHYNCVDEKGVYSNSGNSSNPQPGGYMYDIKHPISGLSVPKPQNGWRWPEETFWSYAKNDEIEWGADESTQPHIKKRIETAVDYLRSLIYEDNRATTRMVADMFGGCKIFDNPKPTTVLSRIIDYVTTSDSIVLDFFSGSATTAHAMFLANAEQNLNRKFILVQIPEEIDPKKEKSDKAKKVAQNAIKFLDSIHAPHNICEIGKERIRRAGVKILNDLTEKEKALKKNAESAKETSATPVPHTSLDIGFRCLRLAESNMQDIYYTPDKVEQMDLDSFVDNVKPDRTPEDLLFQVMLDLGILLSRPICEEEIAGKKFFNVDNNYLLACFDHDVTDETVKAIAQRKPYYAVFRDSSMASDSVATNFDQIFETYSPDTVRKVL